MGSHIPPISLSKDEVIICLARFATAKTAEATEPTSWRGDVPCQAQSCGPQESLVPSSGHLVPVFLAHPNPCRPVLVVNFSLFLVAQDVIGHFQPLKLFLCLFFVVRVFVWVDHPSQTPVFAVDFVLWGVLWQVQDSVKILSFHWKSATPPLIFQHHTMAQPYQGFWWVMGQPMVRGVSGGY